VLAAYDSQADEGCAAEYKGSAQRWAANGLRMRMIALAQAFSAVVAAVEDLAEPKVSRESSASTTPHLEPVGHNRGALREMGPGKAEKFGRDLKGNDVRLLGAKFRSRQTESRAGILPFGLAGQRDVDSMIAGRRATHRRAGDCATIPAPPGRSVHGRFGAGGEARTPKPGA